MSQATQSRSLAATFVLCAAALFLWPLLGKMAGQSPGAIVASQSGPAGQAGEKIVQHLSTRDEPVEIKDLKLKGVGRALGQPFHDDSDEWFRDLKIKVKNRSGKSILYLQVNMLFDRPRDAASSRNPPFSFYLRFGRDPRLPGEAGKIVTPELLPHGTTNDLGLSENDYNRLQSHFRDLKYSTKVNKIRLVLGLVAFDDGTAWAGGRWYRRNYNKGPNDVDGFVPMDPPPSSAVRGTAHFFTKAGYGPGNLAPPQRTIPLKAGQIGHHTGICSVQGFPRLYFCLESQDSDCMHESATLLVMDNANYDYYLEESTTECTRRQSEIHAGEFCAYERNYAAVPCDPDLAPTPTPTPASGGGVGGEGYASCDPPCTNEWVCYASVCSHASPIVIDVAGDGFGLTSGEGGVYFDLNGDGAAEKPPYSCL